jgi:hypothetical protein
MEAAVSAAPVRVKYAPSAAGCSGLRAPRPGTRRAAAGKGASSCTIRAQLDCSSRPRGWDKNPATLSSNPSIAALACSTTHRGAGRLLGGCWMVAACGRGCCCPRLAPARAARGGGRTARRTEPLDTPVDARSPRRPEGPRRCPSQRSRTACAPRSGVRTCSAQQRRLRQRGGWGSRTAGGRSGGGGGGGGGPCCCGGGSASPSNCPPCCHLPPAATASPRRPLDRWRSSRAAAEQGLQDRCRCRGRCQCQRRQRCAPWGWLYAGWWPSVAAKAARLLGEGSGTSSVPGARAPLDYKPARQHPVPPLCSLLACRLTPPVHHPPLR